jgi:hypothetical protein
MKRRGLPSPDLADALAMTFAAEMATLLANADWARHAQCIMEYNPFDSELLRDQPVLPRPPRYYEEGWARLWED